MARQSCRHWNTFSKQSWGSTMSKEGNDVQCITERALIPVGSAWGSSSLEMLQDRACASRRPLVHTQLLVCSLPVRMLVQLLPHGLPKLCGPEGVTHLVDGHHQVLCPSASCGKQLHLLCSCGVCCALAGLQAGLALRFWRGRLQALALAQVWTGEQDLACMAPCTTQLVGCCMHMQTD